MLLVNHKMLLIIVISFNNCKTKQRKELYKREKKSNKT